MSLMYSFTDAQAPAHTACIKRLQLITGHLDIFVECLSSLIELESDFDDTLLDVYVYYATIGLGSACNRTRAAALRILAHLEPQHSATVEPLLPQLKQHGPGETEKRKSIGQ